MRNQCVARRRRRGRCEERIIISNPLRAALYNEYEHAAKPHCVHKMAESRQLFIPIYHKHTDTFDPSKHVFPVMHGAHVDQDVT